MKKIICLLLVLLLFSPMISALDTGARSAVLIDAASGKVLYGKDEYTRRGMASTTKIMTALVAIENIPLDTLIEVPREAAGVEGSSVYLVEGEKISIKDLLYALMLASANDAATAIAVSVAGSVAEFADMMNAKARELGLVDTHFENPHGLDADTHYTSAYELAVIAAHALENETFCKIVSTVKYTIPASEAHAARLLVNHNRLLREREEIIGVKTGFTKKCGRTLVSAAEKDGVRLIAVTLNDGDDWRDHKNMLDYGFSLYEKEVLCTEDEFCFEVPLVGGEKGSVTVKNRLPVSVSLLKGHSETEKKIKLPHFVYAGEEKGKDIGVLEFYLDGRKIGESPLYIAEDIPIKSKK